MTRTLFLLTIAAFLPTEFALADDAAKATVEKAIKAAGWDKRVGDFSSWKGKGKMTAAGQSMDYSGEWKLDAGTGRYRMELKIAAGGQDFDLAFAFDGENAFESMGPMKRDVTGPKLEYTKGSGHQYRVASLKPLLSDKNFKLTTMPGAEGKPTAVKVEYPKLPTIVLTFDKSTSLLLKTEMTVMNEFDNWKDVVDESHFGAWKDVGNGMKEFTTLKVVRGGKTMLESTLSDYVVSDKPEWAKTAFVKP